MNETMTVECPHCGEQFETHTVGDLVACESCDETFARFVHEVIDGTTRGEL